MKSRIKKPRDLSLSELRQLEDYHSLAVVRDPYARTLSVFLDKVAPGTNEIFAKCPGFGDATPSGFKLFLSYLENEGTRFDRHFWPQVDLLYQPIDKFSFIGKLETLSDDLSRFLKRIQLNSFEKDRFAKPHVLEESEPGKITKAKGNLSIFYDNAAERKVEAIYLQDFKSFGYSPVLTR